MHSFLLQDWTTIRAGTGQTTVTQPEPCWLDLELYQDVIFWVQVLGVTGSPAPTLSYQTSPTKDDSFFLAMNATPVTLTAANAPVVTQVLMLSAAAPLATYVRWQLNGTSPPWDVTFRIMVAASAPGL